MYVCVHIYRQAAELARNTSGNITRSDVLVVVHMYASTQLPTYVCVDIHATTHICMRRYPRNYPHMYAVRCIRILVNIYRLHVSMHVLRLTIHDLFVTIRNGS